MKVERTLGWRLKQTFGLIFGNWQKYLGYNLAMWGINVLIVVLTMILIYGIIIGVMPNLLVVWAILIWVLVFFVLWLVSALVTLVNFKLTKDLTNEEETSLDKVIKFAFSNLWNKAVVDFWYFLIALCILLYFILFGLLWSFLVSYTKNPLFFIIVFVAIIPAIYYVVSYYFGFYHCFEERDFSFKKFRESKKLVEGRFAEVLGNLVVIWIISFVIVWIWYPFAEGIVLLITKLNFNQITANMGYSVNMGVWIAIGVYFAMGLYIILRMLADLLSNIMTISYGYIYYKFLKENKVEMNEKVEDILK